MDRYDADQAPDPTAWLALDEAERTALVARHHRGRVERTLHAPEYNRQLHVAFHVLLENQIAAGDPPATAAAVARLCGDGLRRHAALHAALDVALRLLASGEPTDPAAWEAVMSRVDAGSWLGERMRRELGAPDRE
jgi:hypothetical protein